MSREKAFTRNLWARHDICVVVKDADRQLTVGLACAQGGSSGTAVLRLSSDVQREGALGSVGLCDVCGLVAESACAHVLVEFADHVWGGDRMDGAQVAANP